MQTLLMHRMSDPVRRSEVCWLRNQRIYTTRLIHTWSSTHYVSWLCLVHVSLPLAPSFCQLSLLLQTETQDTERALAFLFLLWMNIFIFAELSQVLMRKSFLFSYSEGADDWWNEIGGSKQWQSGPTYYILSASYALVSLVALVVPYNILFPISHFC